ncbi:MAG TPA: glycosyltransferase family 39 protein [Terriglobales bacterium]
MAKAPHTTKSALRSIAIFALLFAAVFALHIGLLRLPYFWDEAGYYVPAARDLLLTGSLIPHSTPSNAHPPLLMGYLALCWKVFGFSPLVTRTAMILVAAFALLGVFRLARRTANTEVAIASTLCTALYPVFFVQSSLAQVDLAAAGLVMWGLCAYTEENMAGIAIWFSLAALAKETAVLIPAGLFVWEIARGFFGYKQPSLARAKKLSALCIPLLPLLGWYAYHRAKTGFIFGNPEFFRYNVKATMHPLRMLLALGMRLWQIFGYLGLWVLTLTGIAAMWRQPIRDGKRERPRIELSVQFAFLTIAIIYVIAMAIVGGAVLARYMLPIVPLVIIIFVSTLWRRVSFWKPIIGAVVLMFAIALYVNPPYGFTFEDNLAYRDYILLHEDAEHFLETHDPHGLTLTAWPGNDEITRPYLGYVQHPMQAVRIDDFTVEQVMSAADSQIPLDAAFVFSTKYQPQHPLLEHWRWWQETKIRFFDYHRDLPPALAARVLGGSIVWQEQRNGQWAAIIEIQQAHDALNLGLK